MHGPVLSSQRVMAGSSTGDEAASTRLGDLGPEQYVPCVSPQMQALAAMVSRVAATSAPVLICGETGVGKSILARQVHEHSPRRETPLVVLHAVTATADAIDRLSAFGGETVLLEEIGELTPAAQDSLVCLLNSASTNGGFRLLTTSSQDVDALANRRILRSDLRYRIDVVRLDIPPLRQRPDDVVFLADHFLAFTARHLQRPVQSLSPDACDVLVRHRWAGNVRELRNCIFESALWCSNQCLRASDLRLHQPTAGDPEATLVATLSQLHTVYPTDLYERTQRLLLQWALVACEGNRSRAAALLGIGRSSLCGKLRRYGLEGG